MPFSEAFAAGGAVAASLAAGAATSAAALGAAAAEAFSLQADASSTNRQTQGPASSFRDVITHISLLLRAHTAFETPRRRSSSRDSASKTANKDNPSSDHSTSAVINCSDARRWR